jgi:hypothetical protein
MGRVAASFKHLTLFILEFDLVEAADLAPLKGLVRRLKVTPRTCIRNTTPVSLQIHDPSSAT